jgi:chromate transporter
MLNLKLFWIFFKIGLFSFGGGFPTLPMMEHILIHEGLITHQQFWDVVSLCQVIPGPTTTNVAAYIGYINAGFLGAFLSAFASPLSVILFFVPCYILFIKTQDHFLVKGFFFTIIPITIALILFAAIVVAKDVLWVQGRFYPMSLVLLGVGLILKYFVKFNSISLILILGILGVIFL